MNTLVAPQSKGILDPRDAAPIYFGGPLRALFGLQHTRVIDGHREESRHGCDDPPGGECGPPERLPKNEERRRDDQQPYISQPLMHLRVTAHARFAFGQPACVLVQGSHRGKDKSIAEAETLQKGERRTTQGRGPLGRRC